jgi:hypothetical protein
VAGIERNCYQGYDERHFRLRKTRRISLSCELTPSFCDHRHGGDPVGQIAVDNALAAMCGQNFGDENKTPAESRGKSSPSLPIRRVWGNSRCA